MNSRNITKALSISSAVLLLSACSGTGKNPFENMSWPDWAKPTKAAVKDFCPQVGLMPDLGTMTELRDSQVVTETVIGEVKPSCEVADDKATVRLSIPFKGVLGPAGVKDAKVEANYSLPYLIAVVNPKGEIISKDIFAITMTYKAGQTEQAFNDLLEQVIPLQKGDNANDYKILLGFQLSEEQLDYNRKLAAKGPK